MLWAGAAAIVVAGIVVALALFEPWRLFTHSTVAEALPVQVVTASVATGTPDPGVPAATAPATAGEPGPTPPVEPMALATGAFVDGEHGTSGTASILQLPDGSRYVRLENFSTSDGPDVQVWLSDKAAGGSDWGKYDDGVHLSLGELKATAGNQNYRIPADANLSAFSSVVIWCDRVNVAFGTAPVGLRT